MKACCNKTCNMSHIYHEISTYCNDNLPRFSRPTKIVILDAMPRTQMGKVDFMKLCDPAPTERRRERKRDEKQETKQ